MIKTLRKRHLQIWILWAVLLPVGIVAAWMVVPEKVTQELIESEQVNVLPVKLGTQADKGRYYSTLRTTGDRLKYQLHFEMYNGFDYSSNPYSNRPFLIYRVAKPAYELLGRVGGKGKFYFNLQSDSSDTFSFIIYDPLERKKTDSLIFNKH
jgi:hypothetical protein